MYKKVAADFCSGQGAMKEQSLSSVTEEQRRVGQKDQDLVCSGFSGNDTKIHFEINRRVQNQGTVTGLIEGMNYLTDEVRKAKVCCEGTTNLKSECVTCSWTEEAVNAYLDLEGFDQEVSIETDGDVLPADDCVCETEPADEYQEACVGSNCVAQQVGIAEFEVYLNSYPVDTLYSELQRIAGYFDSLGVPFYASITDYRMFCAEGASNAFKSQSGNKDLLHFQAAFDAAEVAFWFHLAEVDGAERLLIRQKGFEGDVLDCCCELIPGDCRSNPVPVCETLVEIVDHYEAVCLGKRRDFRFLVEGNYYKHNKDVFVCPKNYPVDVTLVDAITKLPVDSSFAWNVNGSIITEEGHTIVIDTADLESNEANLECEFSLKNGPKIKDISLKLEVRDDIEVEIKKSVSTLYAFDENKIDTFREYVNYGEKAETPWLFIESGKMDEVLAEVNKNNHYYAVNAMESPEPQLTVTPSVMASEEQEMELNHSGSGRNIYEIFACDGDDPELLVFASDKKEFMLNIFVACESDDDIQIVDAGDSVSVSNEVCIDGGNDNTLDELYRFLDSELDSVGIYNGRQYVFAGKNLVCDESKHNSNSEVSCPAPINVNEYLDSVNTLYNSIGIYFHLNDIVKDTFNYEIVNDDNTIDNNELNTIKSYYQSNYPELVSGNSFIFPTAVLVDTILNNNNNQYTSGRTTDYGSNLFAISSQLSEPSTMTHEIGHATYGLDHPKEQFSFSSSKSNYNFMYYTSTGRINVVRRYQFDLIHKE